MLLKPKKHRTSILFLIAFLSTFTCFLFYYQLLYKSESVNSNIFKLAFVLSSHHAEIWSVKFDPKEHWLASGSVDSTVKVWSKENGALLLDIKQPSGVTYVTFSPDGKYLATAAYDSKVRLWKLPEGVLAKEFSIDKGTIWSVCFSYDGKILASCGEDATIHLWDVKGSRLVRILRGHTLNIWDVKFSPDDSKIASGSFDKTIKIWDAANGNLIRTIEGHSEAIVAVAFSHNGKKLATTSDDKTIRIWNTTDWHLERTWEVPEHIQAVDFSPDDKMLLTGGRDKPVMGEFLQNFFGDSKFNKGVSMRLWDMQTGKLLQTFSQHANDVNDVSYSPDGKWIASASSDHTVELWHSSF